MPLKTTVTTIPTRLVKRLASGILLAVLLINSSSCAEKRIPVRFEFSAIWAGEPIACGNDTRFLTDLRFIVSNIVLIDSNGVEHAVQLKPDGRWQQENLALIDLENGQGSCRNGTIEMNNVASGSATTGDYTAIRYTIGVPFEQNHANPLLATAPLDDSAMHWHWRSGYKFLRVGVATPTDGFWLHLGSTGCMGTVQNITECSNPNRITVTNVDFTPDSKGIAIDVAELVSSANLEDGIPSDCSSGPAESECAAPFGALGLARNGRVPAAESTLVFQVRR